MNRRIQTFFSVLLLLSFCWGGMVALSPTLHVMMEHGGRGPAHIHRGGGLIDSPRHAAASKRMLLGSDRASTASSEPSRFSSSSRFFVPNHHGFALPSFALFEHWHAWIDLLTDWAESRSREKDPSSQPDGPDHGHHSLPQLMASGLLDQAIEVALPRFSGEMRTPREAQPPSVPQLRPLLDPHTASRPPPMARSRS